MSRPMLPGSWKETGKHGRHRPVRLSACGWVLCLLGAMLLLAEAAPACDTPVYHYTIQMWQRDPYHAYYFYSGAEDTADAPVNEYLERIAQGAGSHVNLAFARVDVNNLDSVDYTDEHRQVRAPHQSQPLPFYVILTPRWTELFAGKLDLNAAQALIDSPKRRQIAEQLCQGKQGLLLLLLGPNQAENAKAQKIVREALSGATDRDQGIGFVEVARDDPQEKWLVRQLLLLEDDLQDLDNTMLFPVFGRGHALEPCLGKGITTANLLELVAFMKGPCACEIKTASAGMDLLTNYNWQARVAHWPQPTEAPLSSLLFDIPAAPDTEATDSASVPGAKAEEAHSSPAPPAESRREPESPTQEKGGEGTSAAAGPDAKSLPRASVAAGDDQPPVAGPDRPRLAPQFARDLQVEENRSWGSLLSVRLGVALGTAMLLVVAVSLAIIWRRRER